MARLDGLVARVRQAYEQYEFHLVYHAVVDFCGNDLSALHFDISKDRLYTWKRERTRPAQRADGAAPGGARRHPAAGPGDLLHLRGSVGIPCRLARLPRSSSPVCPRPADDATRR